MRIGMGALVDVWVLSTPRREENDGRVEVRLKHHRRLNLLGYSTCPPSIGEDSVVIYLFETPDTSSAIHLLSLEPEKEPDVSFAPVINRRVSLYNLLLINMMLI